MNTAVNFKESGSGNAPETFVSKKPRLSRGDFLKLSGALLGAVGLTAISPVFGNQVTGDVSEIAGSSLDHFEIGHGVNVTIENSWSPAEKAAIKQGILQSQSALEEFFGPPADDFLNFQIQKKTSEEAARLTKDTGMAFDIFPGWTQCGQRNCIVTLTRAPMGDSRDTKTLVHELANAWQGGTDGSFSSIFNYDRATEPPGVVYELGSLFETDTLAFLADGFITSKLNGVPFKSVNRLYQSVIEADPQFLARVRRELKESSLDPQTKLTWQQATDLIEKASPPVGKILKSFKTASNK